MLSRRNFMNASAGFSGFLASPRVALAQAGDYPNRPVRIIVPFTPAGTTDIAARILAEGLSANLGKQFIVENRAGSGGNTGADVVAKADGDGYTILMGTVSCSAINYSLYGSRMPFRPDAFSGIGLVVKVPNVIFVTNDLPVRTLADLVSYAKSRPGQLNYGSSGSGTSLHLTAELLKSVADIDLQHVPFRGSGPMNLEVISGRIHVGVDNLPSVVGHIRDGRVRALAVTTSARSPSLPDLPTTAEAGFPGVEATAWFGPLAPSRTPRAIVEKLGAATNEVVSSPIFWPRLADLGGMKPDLVPGGGTSPDSYQAFINVEISRWSEVVKRSGATVE